MIRLLLAKSPKNLPKWKFLSIQMIHFLQATSPKKFAKWKYVSIQMIRLLLAKSPKDLPKWEILSFQMIHLLQATSFKKICQNENGLLKWTTLPKIHQKMAYRMIRIGIAFLLAVLQRDKSWFRVNIIILNAINYIAYLKIYRIKCANLIYRTLKQI